MGNWCSFSIPGGYSDESKNYIKAEFFFPFNAKDAKFKEHNGKKFCIGAEVKLSIAKERMEAYFSSIGVSHDIWFRSLSYLKLYYSIKNSSADKNDMVSLDFEEITYMGDDGFGFIGAMEEAEEFRNNVIQAYKRLQKSVIDRNEIIADKLDHNVITIEDDDNLPNHLQFDNILSSKMHLFDIYSLCLSPFDFLFEAIKKIDDLVESYKRSDEPRLETYGLISTIFNLIKNNTYGIFDNLPAILFTREGKLDGIKNYNMKFEFLPEEMKFKTKHGAILTKSEIMELREKYIASSSNENVLKKINKETDRFNLLYNYRDFARGDSFIYKPKQILSIVPEFNDLLFTSEEFIDELDKGKINIETLIFILTKEKPTKDEHYEVIYNRIEWTAKGIITKEIEQSNYLHTDKMLVLLAEYNMNYKLIDLPDNYHTDTKLKYYIDAGLIKLSLNVLKDIEIHDESRDSIAGLVNQLDTNLKSYSNNEYPVGGINSIEILEMLVKNLDKHKISQVYYNDILNILMGNDKNKFMQFLQKNFPQIEIRRQYCNEFNEIIICSRGSNYWNSIARKNSDEPSLYKTSFPLFNNLDEFIEDDIELFLIKLDFLYTRNSVDEENDVPIIIKKIELKLDEYNSRKEKFKIPILLLIMDKYRQKWASDEICDDNIGKYPLTFLGKLVINSGGYSSHSHLCSLFEEITKRLFTISKNVKINNILFSSQMIEIFKNLNMFQYHVVQSTSEESIVQHLVNLPSDYKNLKKVMQEVRKSRSFKEMNSIFLEALSLIDGIMSKNYFSNIFSSFLSYDQFIGNLEYFEKIHDCSTCRYFYINYIYRYPNELVENLTDLLLNINLDSIDLIIKYSIHQNIGVDQIVSNESVKARLDKIITEYEEIDTIDLLDKREAQRLSILSIFYPEKVYVMFQRFNTININEISYYSYYTSIGLGDIEKLIIQTSLQGYDFGDFEKFNMILFKINNSNFSEHQIRSFSKRIINHLLVFKMFKKYVASNGYYNNEGLIDDSDLHEIIGEQIYEEYGDQIFDEFGEELEDFDEKEFRKIYDKRRNEIYEKEYKQQIDYIDTHKDDFIHWNEFHFFLTNIIFNLSLHIENEAIPYLIEILERLIEHDPLYAKVISWQLALNNNTYPFLSKFKNSDVLQAIDIKNHNIEYYKKMQVNRENINFLIDRICDFQEPEFIKLLISNFDQFQNNTKQELNYDRNILSIQIKQKLLENDIKHHGPEFYSDLEIIKEFMKYYKKLLKSDINEKEWSNFTKYWNVLRDYPSIETFEVLCKWIDHFKPSTKLDECLAGKPCYQYFRVAPYTNEGQLSDEVGYHLYDEHDSDLFFGYSVLSHWIRMNNNLVYDLLISGYKYFQNYDIDPMFIGAVMHIEKIYSYDDFLRVDKNMQIFWAKLFSIASPKLKSAFYSKTILSSIFIPPNISKYSIINFLEQFEQIRYFIQYYPQKNKSELLQIEKDNLRFIFNDSIPLAIEEVFERS